jgi:chitin disaccharide deacetylase
MSKSPITAEIPPSRYLSIAARFVTGLLAGMITLTFEAAEPASTGQIRLLVRADDMGVTQAANEACIQCYRDGIVRSTEVIVPGAWFLDAVRLLNENPGLDVGVHLCLTSEWDRCKWRPLTHGASIADTNGFFYPMNSQRKDFPPGTGFLEASPKLEEVETELRAQIELLKRHVPRVSHVSMHMGTAGCTPALRQLTERVAREHNLRVESQEPKSVRGFSGSDKTPEQKVNDLAKALEALTPGDWLIIEHPGLDTPEMRALGHLGYQNVWADRLGVTAAFTSPKVQQIVKDRAITLIGYDKLK